MFKKLFSGADNCDHVTNFLTDRIELFSDDHRAEWYTKFFDSMQESRKRKYLSVSVGDSLEPVE